jgi:hypothetical protein
MGKISKYAQSFRFRKLILAQERQNENVQQKKNGFAFISIPKRDRKQVIELDEFYGGQSNPAAKRASLLDRSYKPSQRYDFQFFNVERIHEVTPSSILSFFNLNYCSLKKFNLSLRKSSV